MVRFLRGKSLNYPRKSRNSDKILREIYKHEIRVKEKLYKIIEYKVIIMREKEAK